MNSVHILGNIGGDPELKMTAGGQAVLKFSLATNEKWKNAAGELQEKTQWHRCVMWGKRAEGLAPHLTKGQKIAVTGSIDYGSYEKDGVKHYTTDIKVFDLFFTGKGSGEATAPRAPAAASDDYAGGDSGGDSEIPF